MKWPENNDPISEIPSGLGHIEPPKEQSKGAVTELDRLTRISEFRRDVLKLLADHRKTPLIAFEELRSRRLLTEDESTPVLYDLLDKGTLRKRTLTDSLSGTEVVLLFLPEKDTYPVSEIIIKALETKLTSGIFPKDAAGLRSDIMDAFEKDAGNVQSIAGEAVYTFRETLEQSTVLDKLTALAVFLAEKRPEAAVLVTKAAFEHVSFSVSYKIRKLTEEKKQVAFADVHNEWEHQMKAIEALLTGNINLEDRIATSVLAPLAENKLTSNLAENLRNTLRKNMAFDPVGPALILSTDMLQNDKEYLEAFEAFVIELRSAQNTMATFYSELKPRQEEGKTIEIVSTHMLKDAEALSEAMLLGLGSGLDAEKLRTKEGLAELTLAQKAANADRKVADPALRDALIMHERLNEDLAGWMGTAQQGKELLEEKITKPFTEALKSARARITDTSSVPKMSAWQTEKEREYLRTIEKLVGNAKFSALLAYSLMKEPQTNAVGVYLVNATAQHLNGIDTTEGANKAIQALNGIKQTFTDIQDHAAELRTNLKQTAGQIESLRARDKAVSKLSDKGEQAEFQPTMANEMADMLETARKSVGGTLAIPNGIEINALKANLDTAAAAAAELGTLAHAASRAHDDLTSIFSYGRLSSLRDSMLAIMATTIAETDDGARDLTMPGHIHGAIRQIETLYSKQLLEGLKEAYTTFGSEQLVPGKPILEYALNGAAKEKRVFYGDNEMEAVRIVGAIAATVKEESRDGVSPTSMLEKIMKSKDEIIALYKELEPLATRAIVSYRAMVQSNDALLQYQGDERVEKTRAELDERLVQGKNFGSLKEELRQAITHFKKEAEVAESRASRLQPVIDAVASCAKSQFTLKSVLKLLSEGEKSQAKTEAAERLAFVERELSLAGHALLKESLENIDNVEQLKTLTAKISAVAELLGTIADSQAVKLVKHDSGMMLGNMHIEWISTKLSACPKDPDPEKLQKLARAIKTQSNFTGAFLNVLKNAANETKQSSLLRPEVAIGFNESQMVPAVLYRFVVNAMTRGKMQSQSEEFSQLVRDARKVLVDTKTDVWLQSEAVFFMGVFTARNDEKESLDKAAISRLREQLKGNQSAAQLLKAVETAIEKLSKNEPQRVNMIVTHVSEKLSAYQDTKKEGTPAATSPAPVDSVTTALSAVLEVYIKNALRETKEEKELAAQRNRVKELRENVAKVGFLQRGAAKKELLTAEKDLLELQRKMAETGKAKAASKPAKSRSK